METTVGLTINMKKSTTNNKKQKVEVQRCALFQPDRPSMIGGLYIINLAHVAGGWLGTGGG